METGFESHFEHKEDSCTDMAEKQLSKRLKAPLWTGSQNIWLNLQIKEGSLWECHALRKTWQNKTLPSKKRFMIRKHQ